MDLNTCEMCSNGIKIAFFSKKLRKIAQRLGALPPDSHSLRRLGSAPRSLSVIRLNYSTLLYSNTSPNLGIFAVYLLV